MNFRIPKFTFRNDKKGFTILYAVLVAALALSLGLTIFNITLKELRLSAAGRESQFAFYAADSGVECALFIDALGVGFPTSTASTPPSFVDCGSHTGLVLTSILQDSGHAESKFTLTLEENSCAQVTVFKTPDRDGDGYSQTEIESRGQNDCVNLDNPNRVERAIRSSY